MPGYSITRVIRFCLSLREERRRPSLSEVMKNCWAVAECVWWRVFLKQAAVPQTADHRYPEHRSPSKGYFSRLQSEVSEILLIEPLEPPFRPEIFGQVSHRSVCLRGHLPHASATETDLPPSWRREFRAQAAVPMALVNTPFLVCGQLPSSRQRTSELQEPQNSSICSHTPPFHHLHHSLIQHSVHGDDFSRGMVGP